MSNYRICLVSSCGANTPLVSGTSPIPDAQMTASSEYDDWHGPRHARLNNIGSAGCWLAGNAEKQNLNYVPGMYLQVC